MRFLTLIKKNRAIAIIFLAVLSIALTNFEPGTILSGWDNLHPEFNFLINIKRSIFSVWQEYQGLGLLGGMGHAADLPRQIFLWLISFFIPLNIIRYFFHFLALFIGPLGVYVLMNSFILDNDESKRKIISLSSALFYLFNLATIQMFNVPFEPYSVHYAMLPWLIYSNLLFYHHLSRKNLFILLLVNFFAIPQGYIATFFLVYFIALSILFFQLLLKKGNLKRIFISYLVLIIANAYWLLPNLYFVKTKVGVNISSKINQMSTADMLLRNKKYGDFTSVLLLKSFWFDNTEVNNFGKTEYQLQAWIDYLKDPLVNFVGFLFISIVILGVIYSILNRNNKALLFIPILLFAFIILANNAPLVSYLSKLFYKIPLTSQVFRFPFTKLSILYILNLSIFFGLGLLAISNVLKTERNRNQVIIFLSFLPLVYCLPVFSGNLFYYKVRSRIPEEYNQLYDFFKTRPPSERIANFPQYTFWGWSFYRWNYSGSGFIWYGIEQPVLDRAFDVWSREDENYFHEVSQAVYSGDLTLFEKVLRKYHVSWIIFDGNLVSFSNSRELYTDKLEDIINRTSTVKKVKQFGKISLFKVNNPYDESIYIKQNIPIVLPGYISNNYDRAYDDYGDYLSSGTKNSSSSLIYYPFRSLFTGRSQNDLEFKLQETENSFILNATLPEGLRDTTLFLPKLEPEDTLEVDKFDFSNVQNLYPRITLDGKEIEYDKSGSDKTIINLPEYRNGKLEVIIPKIFGYYSYTNENPLEFDNHLPFTCENSVPIENTTEKIEYLGNKLLRLTTQGGVTCSNYHFDYLSHNFAYLLSIENRNLKGKSLYVSLINANSYRADMETYLPQVGSQDYQINNSIFIIPPMERYAQGYLLGFKNISIGNVQTINDIGKIKVNPFPYRFLTGIKLIKPAVQLLNNEKKSIFPIRVEYSHPGYYQVFPQDLLNSKNNQSQVLILSQSYDKGWQAYRVNPQLQGINGFLAKILPFYYGQKIDQHLLVNNWENGWLIPPTTGNQQPTTIIIIYLPQYLEYLGFAFWFVLPLVFLFVPRQHSSAVHKSL
ncbi:hypothetical protein A2W14_01600 [Candidatus Gottesmanbacteria bacterium RBG_16_37_8]|uniref:Membrane protein 6-pyruvoyl-tetrahydropterin synthase-related domain-containing protein n=1 Tax=Candidatus Gottesmanbacteria bacterium RBG_16_37_8 TaxID=1798371 RepID=A0A1F5YQM4_9BACT|nr:MAG: hypothetical protein A2W14_01600 [Candidatus Gottesmanbacteria bacterium RBG_16_37_8]